MVSKIKFIKFIFLFLFSVQLIAQSGNIKGVVKDASTQEPLPFSTVLLEKKVDLSVKSTTSDAEGNFNFENVPFGEYSIRVSFVGYITSIQYFTLNSNVLTLENILLDSDSQILKEILVKGEKDMVSLGADKKVYQVSKNINSIGGTAETLMRSIPSVNLDESGNPSIRNMSTTVYVDGKPTQLSLAQIPANQIETVEVISNPSARYDASTSGGILNLVLKKNRANGFNGLASAGVGSNNRYDASLNLTYHQNKWNLTTLYNLNSTKSPLPGYVKRTNYNESGQVVGFFNQNTLTNLDNVFQNGRIVVDYVPNNFNSFSLSTTAVSGEFNTVSSQDYSYLTSTSQISSFGNRNTVPQNAFTNIGLGFDWRHTFAQNGKSLNFISSYTHQKVSNLADWNTTAFNADGTAQKDYTETNKINGSQAGGQYLAQLDFIKPLNDSTKIEMGLRSYTFIRDQGYFFNRQNLETNTFELLQDYSQDAHVNETINAAYFIYNTRLKNNWEMDAGLRVEQSLMHGLSNFDQQTFGYSYPSLSGKNWIEAFFPSFNLSKKLNENASLTMGLSRKVGRPNFRHLFVGILANDRQNITIGNPNVKPEFINTAEVNYSQNFGNFSWLATPYFIYEDHTIKPFIQPLASDNSILVTTFINVKADIQYGMENTFNYNYKNISLMGSFNLFNLTLQTEDISRSSLVLRSKATVGYKFPQNISAQVNLDYSGKAPALQGNRLPVKAMDFAIRKSFMSNRGAVVFAVNDIFNSRIFRTTYESASVFQTSMSRRDIRYYKLSLQLPIGKPNNSFPKKDRRIEKPDVDFS
jgi:outer membrane receptor protein involved in Fe transport